MEEDRARRALAGVPLPLLLLTVAVEANLALTVTHYDMVRGLLQPTHARQCRALSTCHAPHTCMISIRYDSPISEKM